MHEQEIDSILKDILAEVEPTSVQKDGAKRSHNFLRKKLTTGHMNQRILDSFLSGSYARNTAIHPLDDVDIIFIIDPEEWETGLWVNWPDPRKVIDTFAGAIRYRYNNSSVRRQRRSVRLQMNHLDVDVVPAISKYDDHYEVLSIPDVDDEEWIKTAPLLHSSIATEANKNSKNLLKPVIKLLKFWNSQIPSTACFKSFAVETMAIRILQENDFDFLEEGILMFLDFIAKFDNANAEYEWGDDYGIDLSGIFGLFPSVQDTAGISGNIIKGTTNKNRKRFIEHAVRTRDCILNASKARNATYAVQHIEKAFRL